MERLPFVVEALTLPGVLLVELGRVAVSACVSVMSVALIFSAVDRREELPQVSSTLDSKVSLSSAAVAPLGEHPMALGLKKPRRLCWPLLKTEGTVAAEPDLARFEDLLLDDSCADRLLPAVDVDLAAAVGVVMEDFCVVAKDALKSVLAGRTCIGSLAPESFIS